MCRSILLPSVVISCFSVLVTVNRPPAHFSMKLLQSEVGEFHSSSSTAANLAGDSVSGELTLTNLPMTCMYCYLCVAVMH